MPPEDGRGLLVVSNHQTYFDPFWICAPFRRKYRFMAWDKAFNWFFVGWFIRFLGSFPVDTVRGTTKDVLRNSLSALADGATLVVFPEGARSFPDGKMVDFRPGAVRIALHAKVRILPITVRGANSVWSQTMKYPEWKKVEIFYHPPIEPTPLEGEEMPETIERINRQLVEIISSKL